MSCDLTSGRLLNECQLGRSGIKTLYFTKFNDFDALTGVTESGGEITSLGTDPISIYQFDMQDNVGNFEEIPNSTPENGTVFLVQNITLTLFYVKPEDLANLNNLKRGRWTIWALDFQDKIRLFGRTRGMIASGGSDVSGSAPGDKKGLDLILSASEQDYAPFMADFTTVPFDNFANVTVVTTGSSYPAVLDDGNTVLWVDSAENITKDGSDFVSAWGDKSTEGNDLLQAVGTNQPIWSANGVLFDGVDNFMKAVAFTLIQPEMVYIVFKQVTWSSNDKVYDGNVVLSGYMGQSTATPTIDIYSGLLLNSNLPIDTFGIVRALYNGASTKLQVNQTTAVTGTMGAETMGGFTLGSNGNGAQASNIQVKEVIIRRVADSAPDEAAIYSYLASKYSI